MIFLTTKELAARWGYSVGGIENMRLKGRGPSFVKHGSHSNAQIRYKLEDVLRYEKVNKITPLKGAV